MSRQLIIGAKLKLRKSSIEVLETEIEALNKRAGETLGAIDGVEEEEDLDVLEKTSEEIQEELEIKMEDKSKLEKEIEALELELEGLNDKEPEPQIEGERNMTNKIELREGIKGYVRSKGQIREGFTSVEGGALIPEELLAPQKALEETIDLAKLVNVAKVNSGAGKYPVIKKSGGKMISVAELAANPELAKPTITEVAFDIETYRGYIPVSQEVIDDADYDVAGLIASEIADQELNTKNSAISTVLKTATPKAVTGFDGLKTVFNVDLKKVYTPKSVVSASLFNELDITKDGNGRYLLQDDVTVASGKKLFGYEVIVLDDDVIGTSAGNLVGFIGDPKAFCTLFDRNRASVKWVDNDIYGQLLAGFIRFDVEKVDEEAGFYITYTSEVAV